MKPYFWLGFLFLIAGLSCQATNPQGQTGHSFEKSSLNASCDENGMCRFTINGRHIESELYHTGDAPSIERIRETDEEIYLVTLCHGDGCPSMAALIHLLGDGRYYVSEAFGNCNDPEIIVKKRGVLLQFPGLKEALREEASYFYSFDRHNITRMD